jgi:hypothetical protein
MKKVKMLVAGAAITLLSGCAGGPYMHGMIFSDIQRPVDVRDNAVACTKKGESTMMNYLNWIAIGDGSVATAKEKAGIKKVGTVDVKYMNILGIIQSSTTVVCGE